MRWFRFNKFINCIFLLGIGLNAAIGQNYPVKVLQKDPAQIDVLINNKLFTSFLYPDSLEKPVLFPIVAANGTTITRGFPLQPLADEPVDHPHHIGMWFNYENVNGLDFWNNSYAIPEAKKSLYGWIRTDKILKIKNGDKGELIYHANWTNQQKDVLMEETTTFIFSGNASARIIDRVTTLTAKQKVLFKDAKDGLLGLRLAQELQMPAFDDKKFTDDKGNVTIVKAVSDKKSNGNYLTSAGKTGNDAWSSRGKWCMVHGKMGNDSISIVIIDHPKNPNYPTFWHARGYGLFAANPLGEMVFTNSASSFNLNLEPGKSVTFKYRIIIYNGNKNLSKGSIEAYERSFVQMQ